MPINKSCAIFVKGFLTQSIPTHLSNCEGTFIRSTVNFSTSKKMFKEKIYLADNSKRIEFFGIEIDMKSTTTLHLDINYADEFNPYDDYYSSALDSAFMDVISTLIEDISYPVFVIKTGTRHIYALNQAAKEGLPNTILEDVVIDDLFHVNDYVLEDQPVVFFNKQWHLFNADTFEAEGEVFEKIELTAHPAIPDSVTLDRWKHMIAVMLHRFRSPLTGISGYLEFLKDETKESSTQQRASKIDEGVTHLANLMDELEFFYHIPSKFDISKLEPIELSSVLTRVKFDIPEEDHDRIQYLKSTEFQTYQATNDSLEKVLQLLISNALRFSPKGSPVTISRFSDTCIKVSNEGSPIPEDIADHIFHPFVTSRANNLGIGLTMALLFASQFGGTILQTENGENGRIAFTICFPQPTISD